MLETKLRNKVSTHQQLTRYPLEGYKEEVPHRSFYSTFIITLHGDLTSYYWSLMALSSNLQYI